MWRASWRFRVLDPLGLLAVMGFILLIGPLPEEVGWRGYLLDRLQLRWTVLAVILFHFLQNFTGEFLGLAAETGSVRLVLEAAAALFVVLVWGPRTLRREGTPQIPPAEREAAPQS